MNPEEPSLLTHLNEVRRKALPEGGISTIIYCGQVRSESDLEEALNVHRAMVEQEVNHEEVNITGILMGQVSVKSSAACRYVRKLSIFLRQVNTILHVLEGPCYSVLRICNNLAGHAHFTSKPAIQFGSIVYNTEDRPKRFFPGWYSCVLSEQKLPGEDITAENSEDIVFDMACRILELGVKLSTEVKEDDELEMSRYADRFPSRNLLSALAIHNDYFQLEEFVQVYFDPYHVRLISERTWPVERLVKY